MDRSACNRPPLVHGRTHLTNRIITACFAALAAASLAACSAPASATSAPETTQAATAPSVTATTPAPADSVTAAPAAAPVRSAGPGSVKSEPGEDVYDFNIRRDFWATVMKDGATAALYESETYKTWRKQVGYHAPNGDMDATCTMGARIASTPEREKAARAWLHNTALDVPGVRVFAYPFTCPSSLALGHPRNFVVVAAVNPQLKVEELKYAPDGKDTVVFGVPNSEKL